MNEPAQRRSMPREIGGLRYRTIGGILLAAFVVLFIALNRDETEISFAFYDRQTSLWVALTVAAVGGFVAGFLIGRQHYRR